MINRISNKQVCHAYDNRRDELKDFQIWDGLDYWSLYQIAGSYWINERIFKSNREVYDYLLFGE